MSFKDLSRVAGVWMWVEAATIHQPSPSLVCGSAHPRLRFHTIRASSHRNQQRIWVSWMGGGGADGEEYRRRTRC